MIDTEFMRMLNTWLSPVSLMLSLLVGYYSIQAFKSADTKSRKPIAQYLVGIGILFSLFSTASVIIYMTRVFGIVGIGHSLSSVRSFLTNIMIQILSVLLIKIFRNKV